MKTIKLEDLKEFLLSEPFAFIRLLSSHNEVIVPFNSTRGTIKNQIDLFLKSLSSKIHPDGLYILEFRSTISGRSTKINILKGAEEKIQEMIISEDQNKKEFLSYTEALELNKRIIQLEFENDLLKERIAQFEENELSEEEEKPSELLTMIKEVGLPLFDKLLSSLETRNTLLSEQKSTMTARPVAKKPQPKRNTNEFSHEDNQSEETEMESVDTDTEKNEVAEYIMNATQDELKVMYQQARDTSQNSAEAVSLLLEKYRTDFNEITETANR